MATNIPIKVNCGRMPINYSDTWQHTFQAMVRRLKGTVDNSKIITGFTGTPLPLYDIGGPIYDSAGAKDWRAWNLVSGNNDPVLLQIGDTFFIDLVAAEPTTSGSHTQTFQDKDAINGNYIANLIDIYAPRATTILTGTPAAIDWSTTFNFFELLTANTTFTFAGQADGMTITVCLENLGTAFTSTWPTIKWPGGTPPTMPISTGTPGGSAIGIYTFRDIHGILYGELLNASPASPAAIITPGGPPPISNYGGSGNAGGGGANRVYIY